MTPPALPIRLCLTAILTSLCLPSAWAQAPRWQAVVEGESLYVDAASLSLNKDAPAGQKWVDFDAVLNTPVPASQADAAELNAFFGTAPKTFFNHMTLNCNDMSVREHSSGIAHGTFQTPRKDAQGQPIQAFELDQLIEYDLHSQTAFEPLTGTADIERYQQLLCQAPTLAAHNELSLVQLQQAIPNISSTPELIAIAGYPHTYVDTSSLKQRVDQANLRDFNIVYQMPTNDPRFAQVTEPYGLDSLTMVFDHSMNCKTRSMRTNYRAIAAHYAQTALLLEYRPQEDAAYRPITADEAAIEALVCPVAAPATPTPPAVVTQPTVTKPASPFKTDYD